MKKDVRVRLKLLKLFRSRDTDTCVFCGSPEVTKEHVFSRWTHKHMLPRAGKATSLIGVEYKDRVETAEFNIPPLRDWQIKCVCGGDSTTCNNGWMRDLEDVARPIMTPLILGQSTTLSESDQKIVATWAILKIMVAHHQIVHHTRRKQMRATKSPTKGWSVWIGNYKRDRLKMEFLSRPFPVLPRKVQARRITKTTFAFNCVATTQIIKNLFIHVVYCTMEDFGTRWRFTAPNGGPLSGQLVRIWPPSGIRYLWPQKALSDLDAETVADALYNGVKRVAGMVEDTSFNAPTT